MVARRAKRSKAFDWQIENQREFTENLNELLRHTNDLRPILRPIARDFYRGQKIIFGLKSKGRYQDLAPAKGKAGNPRTTSNYKRRKELLRGQIYPILELTGELKDSVLSNTDSKSIFELTKTSLVIGTSVEYGIYHQSDRPRRRIPQRKFIFIDGGPNDASRSSAVAGRRERWINSINGYIERLTGAPPGSRGRVRGRIDR